MLEIGELYKFEEDVVVWLNKPSSSGKLIFEGNPAVSMPHVFMLLDCPKNYPAGPNSFYYAAKILFNNKIRYIIPADINNYKKLIKIS